MLIFRYARKHWKYFALLAAFAAIFLAVFWLYGLPLEPVLYGGALCAAQAMSASRVGDALAVELVDEYGAAHQVLLAPKAAL